MQLSPDGMESRQSSLTYLIPFLVFGHVRFVSAEFARFERLPVRVSMS